MAEYELIRDTDPYSVIDRQSQRIRFGEDRQEDIRRIATGDYLIKIGLRPDEVK